MRARPSSGARRLMVLALLALVAACTYNSVWNARHADGEGNRALLDGDDSAAIRSFALAAAAAETVLARNPTSRWTPEALTLAGRALAFSGDCGRALTRLDAARAKLRDPVARDRASLAAGWCLLRQARYSESLMQLEPLQQSRDHDVATLAARWTARAMLAQGNATGAARVLARTDSGAAEWTLARDAADRGEIARSESLLVRRIADRDLRPPLIPLLEDLWLRGDTATAFRIATLAAQSRGPAELRAAAAVTIADRLIDAGRGLEARALLAPVPKLSSDTVLVARARDAMLGVALRELPSLEEIDRVARREALGSGRYAYGALLARVLVVEDTATGAGRFLAAEVLRDSLLARRAARTLFMSLPIASPLAAKGWLAAAAMTPDSAQRWVAAAHARWPNSPYLAALDGKPSTDTLAVAADTLLRRAWDHAIVIFTDSVAARANHATKPEPSP
ncbi:MAG: hypothetical protein ACJ79K_18115 [Gemmatimonadaceae bacterium]